MPILLRMFKSFAHIPLKVKVCCIKFLFLLSSCFVESYSSVFSVGLYLYSSERFKICYFTSPWKTYTIFKEFKILENL